MSRLDDLRVAEAADLLEDDIFELVKRFPTGKRFGITEQLCSAAHSVASNIAEAIGRPSLPDRIRVFGIAMADLRETECHLKSCWRRGFIKKVDYWRVSARGAVIRKMLAALIKDLEDRAA